MPNKPTKPTTPVKQAARKRKTKAKVMKHTEKKAREKAAG